MIPDSSFTAVSLNGIPYLLPYGQNIADHLGGISTNETGLSIWNALQEGKTKAEILNHLTAQYEFSPAETALLDTDLDAFLKTLSDRQITGKPSVTPAAVHSRKFIKIGPLTLSMRIPDALFWEYFSDFAQPVPESLHETADTKAAAADAAGKEAIITDAHKQIDQEIVCYHHAPLRHENGQVLLRNEEMLIQDCSDKYIFIPLHNRYVYEIHTSKDGRLAQLYCKYDVSRKDCHEELFHALRFAFLTVAAQHDLCIIHSASILYREKAWLFSGRSGAGKSTHTGLWHNLFGTSLLNGDLNMIGLENNVPVCYGLPWCGTSGIHTNSSHPLGGIVFLKQAAENKIEHPSADRKTFYFNQRLINPCWTEEQLRRNLSLSASLTEKISVWKLCCTKDPEAAVLMRKTIDESMDGRQVR